LKNYLLGANLPGGLTTSSGANRNRKEVVSELKEGNALTNRLAPDLNLILTERMRGFREKSNLALDLMLARTKKGRKRRHER